MRPTSSRRRRKRDRKSDNPRYDERVKTYRKERRKESVRECCDYRGYERKRKEEGGPYPVYVCTSHLPLYKITVFHALASRIGGNFGISVRPNASK